MFADYLVVEWAPNTAPFAAPTWVDITQYVRGCVLRRGFNGVEDVFTSGSAVFETNASAAWISTNTWYRWRQIRVRSVAGGSSSPTFVLWRGFVTAVAHDVNPSPTVRHATLTATDALGMLAANAANGNAAAYFTGTPLGDATAKTFNGTAGYVTNAGAKDVLTYLLSLITGYPFTLVTDNTASHMPVFVESQQTGNTLQLLQRFLEAEQGRVESTPAFELVLQGRWKRLVDTYAGSTVTFTDAGGNYKYLRGSLEFQAPDDTYVDSAIIQGVTGDPQTASAVPANYPPTMYSRTSDFPIADPNWCKADADLIVTTRKSQSAFVKRISCQLANPTSTSVDTTHPALGNRLGQRTNVVWNSNTYPGVIAALEHDISVEKGWRASIGFADATGFTNYGAGPFKVGTSALGGTDVLAP